MMVLLMQVVVTLGFRLGLSGSLGYEGGNCGCD